MSCRLSIVAGVFLALASCHTASAQDVIVTIKNDSIACKVVQKDDMFVYYRTASTKRGISQLISRREVKEILTDVRPADPKVFRRREVLLDERFRFVVKGGYSLLISTNDFNSDEFDTYYEERNSGYWYAFDAVYMFEENFGAGLTAGVSRYGNRVLIRDANSGLTGRLSDDITVQYIGINFIADLTSNRSNSGLTLSGGLGVTKYKNDFELFFPFEVRGFDFGMHLNGAYRLSVAPGVFVPIELGFRGFSVNNINYTTPSSTPPDMEESIGRFIRGNLPAEVFRIEVGVGLIVVF